MEQDKTRRVLLSNNNGGAHPGGTAAIGEAVNKNLETKIKGLFVCDASVLPTSPGLPPILAIIALSKRFARKLGVIKKERNKHRRLRG